MKKNISANQIMVLSTLFFILFHVPVLGAQEDQLPKAEDIINRYIEVTGGEKAYEKIYNRKIETTVTYSRNGFKTKITSYQKKPNKHYSKIEIMTPSGMLPVAETGTDGQFVWTLSRGRVGTVFEGEEKENMLISFSMTPLLSWKTYFERVKTAGMEDIDGLQCYKVVMFPFIGDERIYFFEKDSGLLKKTVVSPPKIDPGVETAVISYVKKQNQDEQPLTQKDKNENYMSDYKIKDGVLMSHKVKQVAKNFELFISVINSIQHNIEMPDDQFDLPDKIQRRLQAKELIK